ncbi:hypothetical protein LNKW23_14670 [Paralimibaculum aggregatum]|uniref:Pentapeptide repeat-containing protein n=1 Tax=Paralimibaculum aggregatum TaxID=3036245 RepID=A0ABQ6LJB1_9RHOB|nr:pentapeptide repeat-containing protein [Limibaculum sp. NKW23]GMG82254.1 hypothetical protein LNKW23_14670 [Limibaculum sp. NKW23]
MPETPESPPPKLGKAMAGVWLGPARRLKSRCLALCRWLPENYLWPILLLAAVLLPFWLLILVLVADNLVAQLAAGIPADATDKRAHFYGVGLTITGLGAVLAAPFILIKAWINERQARTAEQGHITDRITKAVEQLGAEKTVKTPKRVEIREVKYRLPGDREGTRKRIAEEIRFQPFELPPGATRRENGLWAEHPLPETYETTEPNLEVRLGAIYALERIAEDSARDHIQIMEILCAYIRQNAPASMAPAPLPDWDEGLPDDDSADARKRRAEVFRARFGEGSFDPDSELANWVEGLVGPRIDIRAALTVIGRRSEERIAEEAKGDRPFTLDLRETCLQRADLRHANLANALLENSRLEGANLDSATLNGADLVRAHLARSSLVQASIENATLTGAKLEGANLELGQFTGATLSGARLEMAILLNAILQRVYLIGAHLQGADLRKANLVGATLFQAKLVSATLTNAELDGAALDGAGMLRASLGGCTLARSTLRSTDLREALHLTAETIGPAFGVLSGSGKTLLPEDLDISANDLAHWHRADEGSADSVGHAVFFIMDYQAWLKAGAPTGVDWRDES